MTQNQIPATPSQLGIRPVTTLSVGFLSQAFAWMFVGLLLTASVAVVVQGSPTLVKAAQQWTWVLFFLQIGLVIGITRKIQTLSATAALGLFLVFAVTMGVSLSFIFIAYSLPSIGAAFFSAAGMFGAAAAYGAVTRRSLATMGGYLFMGLIGLLIAMVVNLFLRSDALGYVISFVGVVLFVGLTARDVQKISHGDLAVATGSMEKGAVIGALALYLDFINLFLFIVRVYGRN